MHGQSERTSTVAGTDPAGAIHAGKPVGPGSSMRMVAAIEAPPSAANASAAARSRNNMRAPESAIAAANARAPDAVVRGATAAPARRPPTNVATHSIAVAAQTATVSRG